MLALISNEAAFQLAQDAFTASLAQYGDHVGASMAASQAVFVAYGPNVFCVAREKPIHKQIRTQAREAANACVCSCHPR